MFNCRCNLTTCLNTRYLDSEPIIYLFQWFVTFSNCVSNSSNCVSNGKKKFLCPSYTYLPRPRNLKRCSLLWRSLVLFPRSADPIVAWCHHLSNHHTNFQYVHVKLYFREFYPGKKNSLLKINTFNEFS